MTRLTEIPQPVPEKPSILTLGISVIDLSKAPDMSDSANNPLLTEMATFEANKARLLGTDRNRYALVHGKQILSTWESERDAIRLGYRDLGNVPFLVKHILPVEETVVFH